MVHNMIIKSENGNKYLLNKEQPQILLIHPLVQHYANLYRKEQDLKKWLNENNELNWEGVLYSKADLVYYYQYFLFLMKNSYFESLKKSILKKPRVYNKEIVEYFFANTEQIVFEVTDACNLRCKYCGYGEFYEGYDKREDKYFQWSDAKAIIDFVTSLKQKYKTQIKTHRKIAFSFYGGEPLLNVELIKRVVDYVKTTKIPNIEFIFSITTNGLLLHKYYDYLVGNDFLIIISLDGNEENNRYRVMHNGKPSFSTVYKNIKLIRQKYPKFFKNSVFFNCVIHSKNSTHEVVKYFTDEFGKRPLTLGVSEAGIKQERRGEFDDAFKRQKTEVELDESDSFFKDIKLDDLPRITELENFLKTYSGYVFNNITDLLHYKKELDIFTTGTCNPFEKKIFATVNGRLMPCERISQEYSFGNVKDGKVNIDYQEITDKYNAYYNKLGKLCGTCYKNKLCSKCIFYLNLKDDNTVCDSYQNQKDFSGKLNQAVSMLEQTPRYYHTVMKNLENVSEVS